MKQAQVTWPAQNKVVFLKICDTRIQHIIYNAQVY